MLTLRLEIIGLFRHVRITPKKPRKYGLASGAVSSPPRVLGNRAYAVLVYGDYRSIPARAGEPRSAQLLSGRPRVSPRVRGNRLWRSHDFWRGGSIPARAGEPTNYFRLSCMLKVYPRACGGTDIRTEFDQLLPGLSPRVRGNPTVSLV